MQCMYIGMLYIYIYLFCIYKHSNGILKVLLVPTHTWHSSGKTESEGAVQCPGHGENPLKW